MSFRFNITKATEVACQFIERSGGTINIMKLVKLVYLLDRLSLTRRGLPVVGGAYFSLPNGPITSEFLDLINSGCLLGEEACRWEEFISDRQNHEVALTGEAPSEHLSPAEMDLIEEVYQEHGQKDQWQMRDWCHKNCAEWTSLEQGRDRIPLERIALAVGKNSEQIRRLSENAEELNFLASEFARK